MVIKFEKYLKKKSYRGVESTSLSSTASLRAEPEVLAAWIGVFLAAHPCPRSGEITRKTGNLARFGGWPFLLVFQSEGGTHSPTQPCRGASPKRSCSRTHYGTCLAKCMVCGVSAMPSILFVSQQGKESLRQCLRPHALVDARQSVNIPWTRTDVYRSRSHRAPRVFSCSGMSLLSHELPN